VNGNLNVNGYVLSCYEKGWYRKIVLNTALFKISDVSSFLDNIASKSISHREKQSRCAPFLSEFARFNVNSCQVFTNMTSIEENRNQFKYHVRLFVVSL